MPRLIYSFGAFQLDPTDRRLVCDGREVRLPPKVFELLVILVERHGLLVEKDDLIKALWPDMFVEEITLTGNDCARPWVMRPGRTKASTSRQSQSAATASSPMSQRSPNRQHHQADCKRLARPLSVGEALALCGLPGGLLGSF